MYTVRFQPVSQLYNISIVGHFFPGRVVLYKMDTSDGLVVRTKKSMAIGLYLQE